MMKLYTTLGFASSLMLLGTLIFEQPRSLPTPTIPMNHQSTTCSLDPIQSSLRIWLDPIPHSPGGNRALPPGVDAPAPQSQGSETHALNLELTLVNASQNQQAVRIVEWSWSQGNQTDSAPWSIQPDMSPLNHYNQIERQLVQLQDNQTIAVTVELEINSQPCHLQVQIQP
ncbi:hypothetical protein H6G00_22430 [Leptolyngbya sp. FACHB-541]|uniref:hypothetical protein n=1 Tax=Leptolyngbya sp. FACHB-541 TaxID=2692810 RepID=UPI001682D1E8|nr:hypothetical protein [Leptolyngbya sp. FACHB-541]MBD1999334.1 hypothetical protein [Leptolyngbya sp. FACHB-541]